MSTNTELIARLKEQCDRDAAEHCPAEIIALQAEGIAAIEALESEVERLNAKIDEHTKLCVKRVAEVTRERNIAQAQLAAAQGQLKHLLDDIVEEVEQEGCAHHRIASGKDILFSNMVGACARLLAAPIPQQPAEPAQGVPEGYAPLTIDEIEALTAMVYGAPWERNHCEGLLDVLVMYEELRFAGKRPVDPIDMTKAERRAHFKNAAAPQPKEKSNETTN